MVTTKNFSIWKHLKEGNIQGLKAALTEVEGYDLVELFQAMTSTELVIAYRLLPKKRALQVFELLDVTMQEDLIHSFTEEKAIETFATLDPDDRVRLLDELPATVAKKLLGSLSTEERKMTDLLIGYEAETAGRIMTPEYIRLTKEMTVAQAMEKIKACAADIEAIYTLYITGNTRKLAGSVTLRELLLADSETLIANLMTTDIPFANTHDDQEDAVRKLQNLNLMALPVTDNEMRLVGVITIDDALHILEEEATEDIFNSAGMSDLGSKENSRSSALIEGGLMVNWKARLPYLLLTLAGGLMAGGVIEGFEDVLESVAALAMFIPVIMDMGGNVGTQSSAVFTRGLLLGQIKMKTFWKHFFKEVGINLSLGLLLGSMAGIAAAVWQGMPQLGVAVGLALALTVVVASALGYLIPFILIKLDKDQVAGTGAIITTIKDITGLLIYFAAASFFMGL